jgi:hypothetical protein
MPLAPTDWSPSTHAENRVSDRLLPENLSLRSRPSSGTIITKCIDPIVDHRSALHPESPSVRTPARLVVAAPATFKPHRRD